MRQSSKPTNMISKTTIPSSRHKTLEFSRRMIKWLALYMKIYHEML